MQYQTYLIKNEFNSLRNSEGSKLETRTFLLYIHPLHYDLDRNQRHDQNGYSRLQESSYHQLEISLYRLSLVCVS